MKNVTKSEEIQITQKRTSKDQTKISNANTEIQYAAKKLDVPAYVIHLAKHSLQSNDREAVYEWIKMNKGKKLAIQF